MSLGYYSRTSEFLGNRVVRKSEMFLYYCFTYESWKPVSLRSIECVIQLTLKAILLEILRNMSLLLLTDQTIKQ